MATSQRERRASEGARLQQMATSQRERRASEPPEDREARLQQMATSQRERRASEPPEDREARLQQMATRQRVRRSSEALSEGSTCQQTSHLTLLHQPSVQKKMLHFHLTLASLEVVQCTTCLEQFPGLKITSGSGSTECVRCHKDKKISKLYSAANNMHPGVVPPPLQVSYRLLYYQNHYELLCWHLICRV